MKITLLLSLVLGASSAVAAPGGLDPFTLQASPCDVASAARREAREFLARDNKVAVESVSVGEPSYRETADGTAYYDITGADPKYGGTAKLSVGIARVDCRPRFANYFCRAPGESPRCAWDWKAEPRGPF